MKLHHSETLTELNNADSEESPDAFNWLSAWSADETKRWDFR